MGVITHLVMSVQRGHGVIWIIADRLIKSVHF